MRNIILLLSGLFYFSLSAQSDYGPPAPDTLFYRLRAKQLRQLPALEDEQLRALLRELSPEPADSRYRDLSDGNYLEAALLDDVLALRLRTKSSLGIRTFGYAGKLAVQLIDPEERFVTKATILADGKKMRYSHKAGAYLRRDWRVDYLEVLSPTTEDTIIYTIKEGVKRSRFLSSYHDWNRRGLSRILLSPIRWADNTVRYLDRGLSKGDWRMRRRPLQNLFRPKPYGGYLISDKAKYRPGDTLRLSAWVNRAGGKPVSRPTEFKFQQAGNKRDTSLTLVPSPNGRFEATLVLDPDFWLLDKKIRISVLNSRGQTSWGLRYEVVYADYLNKEFKLSLHGPKTFTATDSLTFTALASDANGQAIAGGQLKVRLTRYHIQGLDTAFVEVPWLVYQKTIPLQGTRTVFTIPRSVIPGNTDFGYNLVAWVKVPGAEKVDTRHYINSISSITKPAVQRAKYANQKYLQLNTSWRRDSLIISRADNDPGFHQLHYYLEKPNGNILHEDSLIAMADTLVFNGGATPELDLHFSYFHAGKYYRRKDQLTYLDKELSISVKTPGRIEPGGSAIVNVSVKDDRGRPVKGVNLAAATQNAQLDGKPHTRPVVPYRRPSKKTRQKYEQSRLVFRELLRVDHKIVTDFKVDTLAYFRLRFTDTLLTEYRLIPDSLGGNNSGQLAVFSSREGRLEGIRFLYLNNEMVYFDRSFAQSPYSVVSRPGTYRLTVVTDEREYRIDHVEIRANYQLILGLPADDWPRQKSIATALTQLRKKMLREKIFLLGPMTTAREIEVTAANGRIYYGKGRTPIGLFTAYDSLDYRTNVGPAKRLLFTPGSRHLLEKPRRGISTEVDEKAWSNLLGAGSYAISRPLPEFAYFKFSPRALPPSKPTIAFGRVPYEYKNDPHVRLRVFGVSDSVRAIVLIGLGDTLVLPPRHRGDWILRPGDYQIGFLWPGDRLAVKDFKLKVNTATAMHYRRQMATGDWKITSFTPNYRRPRYSADGYDRYGNPLHRGGLKIMAPKAAVGGITGIVLESDYWDQTGGREPLPFASVALHDYAGNLVEGVTTDINGNFSFTAYPPNGYLEVSYTGYASKRVKLREATTGWLEVVMNNGVVQQSAMAVTVSDGSNGRSSKRAYQSLEVSSQAIEETRDLPALPVLPGEKLLREDFRDNASFVPHLRTGADGRASFRLEVPDDITAWRTHLIGRDRRMRTGAGTGLTKAYLDLQAQLYAPRFLVENDRAELRGLVINRSGKDKKIRTLFMLDDKPQTPLDTTINGYLLQRATVVGKKSHLSESLSTSFGLFDLSGYQSSHVDGSAGQITDPENDGEKRSIPIYRAGTVMTAGTKAFLYPDEPTLDLSFAEADQGAIYLYVYANPLQFARTLSLNFKETKGSKRNSEWLASSLLSQLAYKRSQGEDRTEGREQGILKVIEKLEAAQRPDGGYGWWPASKESYPWISLHVAYALSTANELGLAVDERVLESLNSYLYQSVEADKYYAFIQEMRRRSTAGDKASIEKFRYQYRYQHDLKLFLHLAETGNLPEIALPAATDFGAGLSNMERLFLARIRQLRGEEIPLDQLLARSTTTAYGGRYWRRGGGDYTYRYPVEAPYATLLAYRIFAAAGRGDVQRQIINHLIGRPGNQFPSYRSYRVNTLETTLLLDVLLPFLHAATDESEQKKQYQLSFNDGPEKTVEFPYYQKISGKLPEAITIRSDAVSPLFVSAYQLWFDTQPSRRDSSNFVVKSKILDEYDRKLGKLTINRPCYLEVKIAVKEEAEFVRIEIPIPAGTEYADRRERRGKFVTHREYRRDRVVLYCDRLPEGEHQFRVKLDPRFSGKYAINPARAVLEYAPAISGNNRMKLVEIKE